ncbi:MAG: DNA translocase FtsK, partial [Bacteroidia bacterium]|nr:DNA translocase FtsK [Bacteroidia bacterium]
MTAKGNKLRSPEKKKSAKKSKKKGNPVEMPDFSKFMSFTEDNGVKKFVGLFLLLVSLFLTLSYISFFFTWQIDADKISNQSWLELLLSPEVKVDNWLGKLGAISSQLLIEKGFGIASIAGMFLSTLLGMRILFGMWLLPPTRSLKYSLLGMVLLSTALGFIFTKSNTLFLGGAFGLEINRWLISFLGTIGTGIFISFAFAISAILIFKIPINLPSFLDRFDTDEEGAEKESVSPGEWKDDLGTAANTAKIAVPVKPEEEKPFVPELEITPEEPAIELEVESNEETSDAETDETSEEAEETAPVELVPENTAPEEESEEREDGDVPMDIQETEEEEVLNELNIEELGEYDPTLELSSYQRPHLGLLNEYTSERSKMSTAELTAELEENKNKIVETLGHYNIGIEKIKATVGPTVTLFEIVPKAGIRISKIKNLEDDIALSLAALGIRIIAPIPGKGTIGIEVPNKKPEIVAMKTIIGSEKFAGSDHALPIGLGKTISNEVYVADLAKMPHLLMAGAT